MFTFANQQTIPLRRNESCHTVLKSNLVKVHRMESNAQPKKLHSRADSTRPATHYVSIVKWPVYILRERPVLRTNRLWTPRHEWQPSICISFFSFDAWMSKTDTCLFPSFSFSCGSLFIFSLSRQKVLPNGGDDMEMDGQNECFNRCDGKETWILFRTIRQSPRWQRNKVNVVIW